MAYALPDDALFLGLDSSTQSLKATVLDANLSIVASEQINFDSELPQYKTKDGVYRDSSDSSKIVSPTLMWVEALDLLLEKLKSKVDFGRVAAISGSGQQHGSVYWKKGSNAVLASLDPKEPLVSQLADAFSTNESPIWMDSSTTTQCRVIEEAVGGALELSKLTGSRAYERFTGPQIRKLFQTQEGIYHNTERISLVSSFMASLLIGGYASIDETDAAGMNLMDIKERIWSKVVLEVTAPGLEEKLGKLAPSHTVAGPIAPYFVDKFQFKSSCLVIHWSGDNPNSLAGLTLNTPGDLAISLGTSDTIFGITSEPRPSLEGHVFPNPVDPKSYMVMLVYKNASLTREDVRNRCAKGSWEVFNSYLESTPHLNAFVLGSRMDKELELSLQDLNQKTYKLYLEFMTRTAKLEELANTGHQFLTEFHQQLERLRRPSFLETSNLVNSIIRANQIDRMKVYVESGCKNIHLDVQSISKLHSCKQGLQNHLEKAKILLDELECFVEDAICVMRMADESISHFLDASSGNGVKQDVHSFEEEETEPIHLQDSSILYATNMMVIYQMLKLDYAMQENIVKSLDLKTASSELESYCLMWDLRPYINDSIIHRAWSFVA